MQIQGIKNKLFAIALAMLAVSPVLAQSGVEVSNAWARSTIAAQKTSGVYLDIRSTAAARLVGVASPAAARVELHNMKMEGSVMKMSSVAGIDLAAGQTVKLAPGGYHVMLIDLKQPLKAGDRPSICRSQSTTASSTSVTAGLDCHDRPITPRPVLTSI